MIPLTRAGEAPFGTLVRASCFSQTEQGRGCLRGPAGMIKGLENATPEKRVRELDTFNLEERRPEGVIISILLPHKGTL